LKWNILRL